MNIHDILKKLPHRYPFLLVDRIEEIEVGKFIRALKNITINEPFFTGHFPERPVMPGVLILESLAQAAGILAYQSAHEPESVKDKAMLYFAGIDKARFKRVVEPGDQLELLVELITRKQEVWKFKAQATVNGQLVCSAELLAARKGVEDD